MTLILWALILLLGGVPAGAETVLNVYAQAYTPELSTGDDPRPLHAFTEMARAYERLHPEVRIAFLKQPVGDYRTWMRTQLQGGLAPDLMWAHADWCNEDAKYGWFVKLDPYLNGPNPYIAPGKPGRERWIDQFYVEATNARRAPDTYLYALPIDQVETAVFYNKDLFEKAGATPPKTWAEFMEVHRKLRRQGVIPFQMTGAQEMRTTWARRILLDQLWADRLPEMDVRSNAAAGFPGVDAQEFIRAHKLGIFRVGDPRYREWLRLVKDWSQYWQPGYLAAQDNRLFRLGKAGMWWDGSWYTPQIAQDPLRKFRWGMFLIPPLTRESSPYANTGVARGVGGATSIQYAVTNSAVASGKEELAVDFLRFITAPQNLGPLVTEAQMFVPNVVGLAGAPELNLFMEVLKVGASRFGGEQTTPRYADQAFRTLQTYLGGEINQDEAVSRLERYLAPSADAAIQDNTSRWAFDAEWNILPNPKDAPPAGPSPSNPGGVAAVALAAGLVLFCLFPPLKRLRRHRGSYFFLLPTFLLLVLFGYYPILSAMGHSFTEWKGSGAATWNGITNFREVFEDDVMGRSAMNVVQLLGANILITLTVPLAVAELIFALRSARAQYLYRVLFVIPMVVPGVVILLIWGFLFDETLGLLNQLLGAVGLGDWKQSWLGDPRMALVSLILIGFPWVGGFALLIYYAGLQNISSEVLDSARLDGATGLRRFLRIDLPLLRGQIRLLVVLAIIGGLQGFQTQLLLTTGGPGYATMVPGLHLYQNAITYDRMGYACAIGVVLFLVILGLTYLNLRTQRSAVEGEV